MYFNEHFYYIIWCWTSPRYRASKGLWALLYIQSCTFKDFCLVTVSNVSNNDVNRGFCFLIDDLQAIMLMRLVPTNIGFSLLVLLLTALWLPESKIQYRINRIQFYFECCDYGTFSWSIADKKKEIIVIDLCRRK